MKRVLFVLFLVLLTIPLISLSQGTEDKKIVFYSGKDGDYEIYKMDFDGGNVEQLTNNTYSDYFPSFSSDGSKIVFSSNRDGNYEIYVMNHDGTNQTRLTNEPERDVLPSFSPDGSEIVFVSERDGNLEIYTMDADGSAVTRKTSNSALDTVPSFSPDGSEIIYYSNDDGDYEIYIMEGYTIDQITTNSDYDGSPAYSPDSSKILYVSDAHGGAREIYTMDPDGSNQARLTYDPTGGGQVRIASYSYDGSRIVFAGPYLYDENSSEDLTKMEIYIMDSDGSQIIRLTTNGYEDYLGVNPTAPDFDAGLTTIPTYSDDFEIYDVNCESGRCEVEVTKNDVGYDVFLYLFVKTDGGLIHYQSFKEIQEFDTDTFNMTLNTNEECHEDQDLTLLILGYVQDKLDNAIVRYKDDVRCSWGPSL